MKKNARWLWVLAGAMALTVVIAPWIGRAEISWDDVRAGWWGEPQAGGTRIFWFIRVPRTLMALLAGAGLAMAGAVFQAMFRNPLASPFTLGASSGASFAAALALHMQWTGAKWGVPLLPLAAFTGALVSIIVVYGVARLQRGFSTGTLLLAGVSIGFVSSAGVLLVQFLSSEPVTNATVRWLMGSVEVTPTAVRDALPWLFVGGAAVLWVHRELDLMLMGELVAAGRGVNVARVRALAYFAASVMVAGVVAACGPIAFVGLVVPHVLRALCGPLHRVLLPACAVGGATFLIWCDVVARSAAFWIDESAREIPVGVLTSVLGGLFFIYLLMTRREDSTIV